MRVGRKSVTIVTPPASEPITLSEAKAWARIDDDTDDALIDQLITAARMAAEEWLRRSLITQTRKLTLDLARSKDGDCLGDGVYDLPVSFLYGGLPNQIELPGSPIQSITSVITYDLTNAPSTFDPANYRVDSAGERLVLNYGCIWPSNLREQSACEVTYVTGYGDTPSSVPQPIKSGLMIHVASLYEQRGMCDDAMALPPGTKQLYGSYRIMGDRRG